jgi:hypothetical protein
MELAGVSSFVALLVWFPLYLVAIVDQRCGPDEVPVPWLLRLYEDMWNIAPWLLAGTVAVFILLAWRRTLPHLSGRPIRRQILVVGLALATLALVYVGAALLELAVDSHWLFGRGLSPRLRVESPEGQRIAWAVQKSYGIFGGGDWRIYVQERGSWKMKRLEGPSVESSPPSEVSLEWSGDPPEPRLVPVVSPAPR